MLWSTGGMARPISSKEASISAMTLKPTRLIPVIQKSTVTGLELFGRESGQINRPEVEEAHKDNSADAKSCAAD